MIVGLFCFPEYKIEQWMQISNGIINWEELNQSKNINGTADAVMKFTGFNTGNLVFWVSVLRMIRKNKIFPFSWNTPLKVLKKEKIDVMIFPASNYLNNYFDISKTNLINLIKELNIPTLIFGLGMQGEFNEINKILPGNIEFVREISKRCENVYVRGELTMNVLLKIGINNVKVLGCPSLLLNPKINLGKIIENKLKNKKIKKISVHTLSFKKSLQSIEIKLYDDLHSKHIDSEFIFQESPHLVNFINTQDKQYLTKLSEYYNSKDKGLVIGKRIKYFTNPLAWCSYLQNNFTHSICTRIHGTMISLAGELPTICLYHDKRTFELCKFMKIPCYPATKFISMDDLQDQIVFNGKEFDKNRNNIAKEYVNIFNKYNIIVSDDLVNLAL